MSGPTPNLPLLRKVLDHIDTFPEEHNQGIWGFEIRWPDRTQDVVMRNRLEGKCDTAMCVAGWAVALGDPTLFAGIWTSYDAAALLGLTASEAEDLFYASNTRDEIQRFAERVAARAGERL